MPLGAYVFFIIFNMATILVISHLQNHAMNARIRRLKQEILELEDLVVAIVEEIEEAVQTNKRTLVAAPSEEPTQPTEVPSFYPETPLNPPESRSLFPEIETIDPVKLETKTYQNEYQQPIINSHPDIHACVLGTKPNEIDTMADSQNTHASRLASHAYSHPKQQQILELWQQGMEIPQIARELTIGQGEIRLIIGLYKRS
jgi:hypothetical protein